MTMALTGLRIFAVFLHLIRKYQPEFLKIVTKSTNDSQSKTA